MDHAVTARGRLAGKAALVTGGTAGIGLGIARTFLAEGASVVISGRDTQRAERALARLRGEGDPPVRFVQGDVTVARDAEAMVREAVATFGRLEVLVNNAGLTEPRGTVVELAEADWEAIVDCSIKGAFLCSKFAIPEMVRGGGGVVIHISSGAGLVGRPQGAAYCTAKGGLVLLTKNMALDFAAQGVRVNCICPGGVETERMAARFAAQPDPDQARRGYASIHPLGLGRPEDIGWAAVYLASDEARWVTGAVLAVDGGATAGLR